MASRCGGRWLARNKKSVTVNLREKEGQEIARNLIATSDILIENFRPGTLERWNMSYEQLSKENPKLIMVRVSGYGQTGPYAQRAGFGSIGEAMGGLRYVVGDPSMPPSRMGISIGDSLAATYAALGAMMAMHARRAHRARASRRQRDLRGRAGDDGVARFRISAGRLHPRADGSDPAEHRAIQRLSDQR